ncbi:hypothetical protein [Streptomyces sp. NPDC088707]|uniref:hypothetical protein n=1 Tax=Streptomyces sp. NPDC088707 TaxID=3365871 RepID=UPI003809A264
MLRPGSRWRDDSEGIQDDADPGAPEDLFEVLGAVVVPRPRGDPSVRRAVFPVPT